MNPITFLAVVAALVVVVVLVGGPLHRAAHDEAGAGGNGRAVGEEGDRSDPGAAEAEAELDAKLREIRDAELDWRTGKLSEPDWRELDASLRAEAALLLKAGSRDSLAGPPE